MSAIYCPPKHKITEQQFHEFFESLGNRFISGGDYNAKHHHWGSRVITPRGRQLLKTLNANNLCHLFTGEPTYWPTDRNKIPDLLDFCVVKGTAQTYLNTKSCLDLTSDHSPVLVSYSVKCQGIEKTPYLCNQYTDWKRFREIISEKLDLNLPLKTNNHIDVAVEHLTTLIQKASWTTTPELDIANKTYFYPEEIKKAIANKRKVRRIWQNN